MNDWYLVRYLNSEMIDRSPYGMSKGEAESIANLANGDSDGFTYKVERELKDD